MNSAEYNQLSEWQKANFQHCRQCDEWYDCRDISTVLWHHDHIHRPDVQSPRGVNTIRLLACAAALRLIGMAKGGEDVSLALYEGWLQGLDDVHALKQLAAFDRDIRLILEAFRDQGPQTVADMLADM